MEGEAEAENGRGVTSSLSYRIPTTGELFFRSLFATLVGFALLISLKKREKRIIRNRQIATARSGAGRSFHSRNFIAKERETTRRAREENGTCRRVCVGG